MKLSEIDKQIQKTLEGITLKEFIKFLIGPTLASIMTWFFSFKLIEAYSKASYSKETILAIAIIFTVLYYIIGICKMIPDNQMENTS